MTMKGIDLIHISSNTWWGGFWTTDDAGIIFVSNYSTVFENIILSHTESYNNCLDRYCIIDDVR